MSYRSLNFKLVAEFLYNIPYNNKIIIVPILDFILIILQINLDIPRKL